MLDLASLVATCLSTLSVAAHLSAFPASALRLSSQVGWCLQPASCGEIDYGATVVGWRDMAPVVSRRGASILFLAALALRAPAQP
eukprot:7381423-Prymnesium_polylepis.2